MINRLRSAYSSHVTRLLFVVWLSFHALFPPGRMMTGAEKAAWDSTPWDNSPLLVEIELTRNRAWYTFGYTFGYLGEQCVTAAISAGTVTVGKIIAKNGTVLIGKLAPRAMGVLAVRLHFIKQALHSIDLADDGLRYAYEGMMSSAARQPTTPLIKEIPASLMENRMAAQGFDRATFNFKEWVKTATPNGNVRKLIKSPGREGQYLQKASHWMNLMGDKATANASKGWAETYERLLKFEGDDFVEDRADDFFSLMKLETAEGREAARKSLEDYAAAVANDPNAKLWIKDLDTIQTKGYRHVTQFELDQITANGGKLPLHPEREGQYFTLDGWYSNGSAAKDALQLPRPASEYVGRIEFDIALYKDNIRLSRGENDSVNFFEPLARDNPNLGATGGGTQLLLDSAQPSVTFTPF